MRITAEYWCISYTKAPSPLNPGLPSWNPAEGSLTPQPPDEARPRTRGNPCRQVQEIYC